MSIHSIIPRPSRINFASGKFQLTAESRIIAGTENAFEIATLLTEYLRPATGFKLAVQKNAEAVANDIVLYEAGDKCEVYPGFVRENYAIETDAGILKLRAENSTGLARAVQTVRQLFPESIFASSKQDGADWSFESVNIEDEPAFCWRGMLLDVGRYFYSAAEVCRLIDLFALHKLNVLHLHLTEDQGWRIEIKRYPRLTEIGSTRKCTLKGYHDVTPRQYDDHPYSGFYTQDEIRTIVEFAARRHIMVVPEIDMPGHMQAAIAAYPELGNHPEFQHEVRCIWGVSKHILNVRDTTVKFMKNVISEVLELFPAPFIHIGGDEVPKEEWELSREAQKLMAERGLKNEIELQRWFIHQIAGHINSHGRRLIGWSEIMDGGTLPENALIMSWHHDDSATRAAKSGYDAIVADCKYTYFDYYQANPKFEPLAMGGDLSCEMVYRFNPIPDFLTSQEQKHIIGGQGNLWTEYIGNMKYLEYMAFPRSCALGEKLWTPEANTDYADFCKRLSKHRKRLEKLNVNAHKLP